MSEASGQPGNVSSVQYRLSLTPEEARSGTTRFLPRNNKRLEVKIPAGVTGGSVVKLTGALRITDGRPGDILVLIDLQNGSASSPGPGPAGVVEITDNTFSVEVLQSELPVVVDFWAPWCGPCRVMAPVMEEIAAMYQGKFKFCKINVDENPETASRYQAMSIPLLLFFKGGQVVEKEVGAIPAARLRAKLDAVLSR